MCDAIGIGGAYQLAEERVSFQRFGFEPGVEVAAEKERVCGDPDEDVAERLRVSCDWVWDHSSRRLPYLPVIRMSDGALPYHSSQIEELLSERERTSGLHRRR